MHYANTAMPGENGNSVFFGHSSNNWWIKGEYKFVFILLDKLEIGDTFVLHYNSKKYLYEVTEKKVVDPKEVSVLDQTSDPVVTLITCTPPGTSWKRLVVIGKQISPDPAKNTEVKNTLSETKEKLPRDNDSFLGKFNNWLFGD